ncbi:hypothetical protein ACH79_26090 [Bradyrhizobium sp. CCBAU 051011]|nr:hypothetical protein ACH79_26090 [Bradyrhizobium sp. CCBAU 051011]
MSSNCRAKERSGRKASDDTGGNPTVASISAGRHDKATSEKRIRGNGHDPYRSHVLALQRCEA